MCIAGFDQKKILWQISSMYITINNLFHLKHSIFQGRDRRVELGYQWSIELRKNIIYPPKNKNSKYNPVLPEVSLEGEKEVNKENQQQEVSASA